MKLPCSVVRDLLPLYSEEMVEPDTKILVEEHLPECPDCQRKYSEIKAGSPAAADTAASTATPLRTLKKQIRSRRWFAALIAAMFVFVIAVTYVYHTGSLKPVAWEDGLFTVEGIETVTPENDADCHYTNIDANGTLSFPEYNGSALILEMDGRIVGVETEIIEEGDSVTAIVQGFGKNASSGQNVSQTGKMAIYPLPDRVIYGYEDPQTLLWGEPPEGGVQVLPRLALSYYVLIAAMLAVLSGLLWFILRKRDRSWIIRQLFFAPLSYILAHLLIMGLRTTSFFITRDFCYIVLTACALYVLISLLWQVLLQKRKMTL